MNYFETGNGTTIMLSKNYPYVRIICMREFTNISN